MVDINKTIAAELNLQLWQVENTLQLKEEGGTLPFIARYRKERTGELDENQLRDLFDRFEYLKELEERKETILKSIDEQGKLTDDLRKKIESCLKKTELEDLYLPYKPKRRTRATIAKENGLGPLAEMIQSYNTPDSKSIDLEKEAKAFINPEKGIDDTKKALKGASDIIAEEISEDAELRSWLRNFFSEKAEFSTSIKKDFPEGTTKYEMYRDFSVTIKQIKPHTMLAMRRGESEGIIQIETKFDEEAVLGYLHKKKIFTSFNKLKEFYESVVKDAFNRLMKHSIIGEVRLAKKLFADEESINVFEKNLRQLLLTAPAGMLPTLGIDPGFRTGCKVAVVDETGKFLEYKAIFPFQSDRQIMDAKNILSDFIQKYDVKLIAIGNGTAGRETDEFVGKLLEEMKSDVIKVIVNESGASVYSASKVANEEFPELDLTVRGAISIARRLQDPLAELVKIDPKSIGVGQYQHDVDQKLLKKKLEDSVESCVNYVGVDLNTASKEVLTYVAGITPLVAKNIIKWRDENGAFDSRKQLLKVSKFGPKAFEQSAGFLRIRNGANLLDNTAVHPESYHVVEKFTKKLNQNIKEIVDDPKALREINLEEFVTKEIGLPTLKDIISEMEKPGRDPREEFKTAQLDSTVKEISDLKKGMELEGTVTNITNFGAFVDIGVHQDGLVHISELAEKFVRHPSDEVSVGEIVKVRVLDCDPSLKRISLSMKSEVSKPKGKKKENKDQDSGFTMDDLMNKFKS
jgi:uncharacterized protein